MNFDKGPTYCGGMVRYQQSKENRVLNILKRCDF